MKMRIKTKLFSGFLAVGTLILFFSVLAYLNWQSVSSHSLFLQNQRHQYRLVRDLQIAMEKSIMPPNDYLITGSIKEREYFINLSAQVEDKIAELESVLPTQKKNAAFEEDEMVLLYEAKKQYLKVKDMAQELLAIEKPISNRATGQLMEVMDKAASNATGWVNKIQRIKYRNQEKAGLAAHAARRHAFWNIFFGLFLAGATGLGINYFITKSIIRSVTTLIEGAGLVGQGHLDHRLNIQTGDELEELANTFNQMTSDLQESRVKLHETNVFLRNILESSTSVSIISTDWEGNILYWNTGAEKIFGYTSEEIVGHQKIGILYPNDEEETMEIVKDVRSYIEKNENGTSCEIVEVTKDERKLWVHLTLSPRFDENGDVIGILSIGEDVTERKKAENKVVQSEIRLKEAQKVAHLGSWELDLVQNVLEWSDEVYHIFEINPETFVSYEIFLEKVHPDDREYVDSAYTESVKNNKPYDIIHRLLMKDGSLKWVIDRGETFYDKDSKPLKSVGIVCDITERKLAEEASRKAHEEIEKRQKYLESVLNGAPDAIVTLDASHSIIEWNPGAEQIFGYKRKEALGKNLDDLITNPAVRDEAIALTKQVISREKVLPRETIRYRKDGTPVNVVMAGSPIQIDGRLHGAMAVYTDITKLKQTEKDLRLHRDHLEEQVEERTKELRILAEFPQNNPNPILRCNIKGKIIYSNLAMELFRKEMGLEKGKTVQEYLPFDYKNVLGIIGTDKTIIDEEIKVNDRVLLLTANSFPDQDNAFIFLQDITERMQAEEQIRQHLAIEHAIAQISKHFTTIEDTDFNEVLKILGKAISVNRAYIFQFRNNRKQMDNTVEWCAPDTELQIGNLQDLDSSIFPWWMKKLENNENIIIPDVDTLPTEAIALKEILQAQNIRSLLAVPIISKNGILTGFIGFDDTAKCREWSAEDAQALRVVAEMISNYFEHKRSEEALQESEERYRLLFNSGDDAVFVIDEESFKVIDVNDVACHRMGYTREEFMRLTPYDYSIREESLDSPIYNPKVMEKLRANKHAIFEAIHVTKDGTNIPVEISAHLFELSSRRTILSIARDITIRKQAEEKIVRYTQELEKANRMKSEFLANMGHELRTPLNAVIGFSEVLVDRSFGEINEKQEKYLNNIHKSGQHLLDMINDILDLTKAEVGRMELEFEEFSLDHFLIDMTEIVKSPAFKKNIEIDIKVDKKLPVIVADMRKLKKVVTILLDNAVKFTPDGGQISMEAISIKDKIQVSVTDTGMGIKPEDHKRIFEGFEQVDTSYTKEFGGTGLGLTLAKKLVEIHGGEIWVESPPKKGRAIRAGKGSSFFFTIPLELKIQKRSILIAEDDQQLADNFTFLLKKNNFDVRLTLNGKNTLDTIQEEVPDLLILDLMLPEIDGYEVLERLRKNEKTKKLPILVLTGIELDDADEVLQKGADEFLKKPISPTVLISVVKRLLGMRILG